MVDIHLPLFQRGEGALRSAQKSTFRVPAGNVVRLPEFVPDPIAIPRPKPMTVGLGLNVAWIGRKILVAQ